MSYSDPEKIEPISRDRTLDVLQIYYFGDDAMVDELIDARTTRTDAWKQVFLGDLSVVEGMQRGRNSPAFDGGRFSEVMDAASHHFAQWVARSLESEPAG